MGYSGKKFNRKPQERRWRVNPVWRGIGCAMLILVPVMAWFGAILFLENNVWVNLPPTLEKNVIFPKMNQPEADVVIGWLNANLGGKGVTYAQFLFWGAFIVLGFGVLAVLYGLVYRVVGPPRYGPLDAPPVKRNKPG